MLAIVIASMGTIACLSLSIASNMSRQAAVENNVAYNAARQILENTRLYKGGLLANGPYTQTNILSLGEVPQLNSLVNPSVSMTVSTWRTRVKYVKVTVSWTSNSTNYVKKSQVLVGLVTSKGLAE